MNKIKTILKYTILLPYTLIKDTYNQKFVINKLNNCIVEDERNFNKRLKEIYEKNEKRIFSIAKKIDKNILSDYLKTMPETYDENLKLIQKGNLFILKRLKQICSMNKLNYCIWSGTLLGAFRHGKFIPWDDDVDVVMMRDDLFKLVDACKNSNDSYIRNEIKFRMLWGAHNQIRFHVRGLPECCYIDIFIYDLIDNFNQRNIDSYKQTIVNFKKDAAKISELYNKNILYNEIKVRYLKDIDINFKKENKKEAFVFGIENYYPVFSHEIKQFFPYSVIFPLSKAKISGEFFSCPNNSEYVLKQLYGENFCDFPKKMFSYYHLKINENDRNRIQTFFKH